MAKNRTATAENTKNLKMLYNDLKTDLNADKDYWLRNDAKLKAVVTSKSYDEFRQTVDAAHLRPLSKEDSKKKFQNKWNKLCNE